MAGSLSAAGAGPAAGGFATLFAGDSGITDPYSRQQEALRAESQGGAQGFVNAIYKAVTGKPRWSQAMVSEDIKVGQQVVDTPLGRYLVSTNNGKVSSELLMTEPPKDKQRYAVIGYTQKSDGTVTQYYAKVNDDRYEASAPITSTLNMPGKILVKDTYYFGKKPQGNAAVKRKGKRNLDD
jgi:hypothetical protein